MRPQFNPKQKYFTFFFFFFALAPHICCVGACADVPPEVTSGVCLIGSLPHLLKQGFSLHLELADSARMASREAQGPPDSLQCWGCAAVLCFLTWILGG